MTKEAKEMLDDLTSKGYTYTDILNSMCEGEYLYDDENNEEITENFVDEIYDFCNERVQK